MSPRAGRHLPQVPQIMGIVNVTPPNPSFASGKRGDVNIWQVEQGDLIRVEIDLWNRAYGELDSYRILVTKINIGETNLGTGFYFIEGVSLESNEKIKLLHEPQRMEIFLESRCDHPSKK